MSVKFPSRRGGGSSTLFHNALYSTANFWNHESRSPFLVPIYSRWLSLSDLASKETLYAPHTSPPFQSRRYQPRTPLAHAPSALSLQHRAGYTDTPFRNPHSTSPASVSRVLPSPRIPLLSLALSLTLVSPANPAPSSKTAYTPSARTPAASERVVAASFTERSSAPSQYHHLSLIYHGGRELSPHRHRRSLQTQCTPSVPPSSMLFKKRCAVTTRMRISFSTSDSAFWPSIFLTALTLRAKPAYRLHKGRVLRAACDVRPSASAQPFRMTSSFRILSSSCRLRPSRAYPYTLVILLTSQRLQQLRSSPSVTYLEDCACAFMDTTSMCMCKRPWRIRLGARIDAVVPIPRPSSRWASWTSHPVPAHSRGTAGEHRICHSAALADGQLRYTGNDGRQTPISRELLPMPPAQIPERCKRWMQILRRWVRLAAPRTSLIQECCLRQWHTHSRPRSPLCPPPLLPPFPEPRRSSELTI
ncbi:hypothetical protein B0H17DRAFT_1190612 [Mycena rosella]|uniref:Uncharacterized protein n=1 Tax=Mycena rosella TaxID=1033263 RepID=A0AAD7MCZ4_MYCRO|nr:hypothetical protein B0H17DRAFT_1190612 [Mycena rosella]